MLVITVLAFFFVRSTSISVNKLLLKGLDIEIEAIYKIFEREYQIKNKSVHYHLNVLHYIFFNHNFIISNDSINIEVDNQISSDTHTVSIKKWYLDDKFLLENHFFVDTINALVGGTATIFQKIDSGYLRISTNVQTIDNQRAIATFIPNNSPVVQTIEQGNTYFGRAFVVNDWYITAYEPLFYNNKLVGMLYVGSKEKNIDELRNIMNNCIYNIKIYTEFPSEYFFNCNENEMNIVFNNLISNAIKYNVDNGKIFVSIKQEKDKVIITTEDTGIGMTEEEINMLFGEFVRIKNKQTKNIEGSGLGLSILKKIVDKYNGSINVKSTPNKGTTFIVELKG